MQFLCDGLTVDQIAQEMRISKATVRNHLSAIYAELGVSTQVQAVVQFMNLRQQKLEPRWTLSGVDPRDVSMAFPDGDPSPFTVTQWPDIREQLLDVIAPQHRRTFRDVVPKSALCGHMFLDGRGSEWLDEYKISFSTREKNALLRWAKQNKKESSLSSLSELTLGEVALLPNAGVKTVRDALATVLDACVKTNNFMDVGVGDETSYPMSPPEFSAGSGILYTTFAPFFVPPNKIDEVKDAFQLLAGWAAVAGESVTLSGDLSEAPESVKSARDIVLHVESAPIGETAEILKRLFSRIPEPLSSLLRLRIPPEGPLPYMAIGRRHDISREIVKKREMEAKAFIDEALAEIEFLPLKLAIESIRERAGQAASLDDSVISKVMRSVLGESPDEFEKGLLAFLTGYQVIDEMLSFGVTNEKILSKFESVANEYGFVDDPTSALTELGVKQEFHSDILDSLGEEIRVGEDGRVWCEWKHRALGDRAAALLFEKGQPLEFEELREAVSSGRSDRSFRNAIFRHPNIIRVKKNTFALKEWGFKEYTTIVSLIEDVIEEKGGRATKSEIARELSEKFSVPEHSCVAYLKSAVFVEDDGFFRARNDTDAVPFMKAVRPRKGVYRSGGCVYLRLSLTDVMMRGGGVALLSDVATLLGVTPHTPSKVFTNFVSDVEVSWPMRSINPQMSSLLASIRAVGGKVGDSILCVFNLDDNTVDIRRVDDEVVSAASVNAFAALQEWTGIESGTLQETRKILAVSTVCDVGDLSQQLEDLGETELLVILEEIEKLEELESESLGE
jgi:DNA-directed RNA polymerase specialized sigma24 family protein